MFLSPIDGLVCFVPFKAVSWPSSRLEERCSFSSSLHIRQGDLAFHLCIACLDVLEINKSGAIRRRHGDALAGALRKESGTMALSTARQPGRDAERKAR